MPASLDIVIVNWNTGSALGECLRSIDPARTPVAIERIVVVDNASTDDSMAAAVAWGPPVTTVRNATNLGFGAACNQGAAGSRTDYLLFLNPDTRLEPDTLARTLAFLEERAQDTVGICGVRLVDEVGQPSTVGARFPTPRVIFGEATGLSRWMPALFPRHLLGADECRATRDVDQVIGAYFMIRRRLFDELGGFDERFFVYFEEVDLSLRARRAGFRSVYFNDAQAYHRGGLSSDQMKAARLYYSLRSRLLYAWKHFSPFEARLVMAVTFGIEWPARVITAAARRGGALAETSLAFRRLRAFVSSPDWKTALDLQRQP
jgi:N-acetylglucosaminyl-diphospho-decaprenol L-rhamnosyltransferase